MNKENNREIKFRAWDKEEEKWIDRIDRFPMSLDDNGNLILMNDDELWIYSQYTGLKDKNGKEIYEGHILKIYLNEVYEDVYDEPQLALVKYSVESGFMTLEDLKHKNGGWTLNSYMAQQSEVIGNKFENPNLINK